MSETIRDVVIRISLEQQQAKLIAPDTSPILSAVRRYEEEAKKSLEHQIKVMPPDLDPLGDVIQRAKSDLGALDEAAKKN